MYHPRHQPISGNLLSPKPKASPQDCTPSGQESDSTSSSQNASSRSGRSLRNLFARRHQHSHLSSPLPTSTEAIVEDVCKEEKLQVSVLVTMPSAKQKLPKVEDADDVPHVAIGVAKVPYMSDHH